MTPTDSTDTEALRYLHRILRDREDVRDGSDGQEPNEAMSILVEFSEKFPDLDYRLRLPINDGETNGNV